MSHTYRRFSHLPITTISSFDFESKRCLLFNISPTKLFLTDFEDLWKLGSKFWTIKERRDSADGQFHVEDYFCRFKKSRESSPREAEIKTKRRVTSIRDSDLCDAGLKLLFHGDFVFLLPYPIDNTCKHTHTIAESDHIKMPEFILSSVKVEAAKPYPPPNIVQALKKMNENTEISPYTDLLTSQYVRNIQSTFAEPLSAPTPSTISDDINATTQLLLSK
ncbi:hypothetical protein HK098_002467, partial [Nowakowskiella sp. JEL0407]